MDSDDKKITQLPLVTSLSDSDLLVTVVNIGSAPQTKAIAKSNAISDGLTVTSASVTTSNVTGVEGTLHNLDVSGMTANRDFNLPTPSATGKRVGVRLSTGDATYALLLKINTVEWSRIFITSEIVIFVSTGTGAGDWAVEYDGRIAPNVRIYHDAAQTISNATFTVLSFNTERWDVGENHDTSTNNSRITVRRAGKYIVSASVLFDTNGTGERIIYILRDGTANIAQMRFGSGNGATYAGLTISSEINMTAGQYFTLTVYQSSGGNLNILASDNSSAFNHCEFMAQWVAD